MQRLLSVSASGLLRFALALVLVALEAMCRVLAFLTPSFVIRAIRALRTSASRSIPAYKWLRVEESADYPTYNMDTLELIEYAGYAGEQHTVVTPDGFLLVLHRIARGKGVVMGTAPGPPVVLQHGLMQNSEVWVTTPDSLAFMLADAGFDVWLGNSRGNRYSCTHVRLSARTSAFWDFCLDEHARGDFPAVLAHVLATTGAERLSYVGFSQGTAQAFAALSVLPELERRVGLFVALAPAARAHGLRSGLLRTFVDCAPESIFLLFGDREMLGSATFWRGFLPPSAFTWTIDAAVRYLFNWRMANLSPERKRLCYPHLYSHSSVKTVVHWFQIVIAQRFQSFDERYALRQSGYAGAVPPQYPMAQIRAPIALYYGGCDELPDMPWILNALKDATVSVQCVQRYEHLDFLWADDVHEVVYKDVVARLRAAQAHGGPSSIVASGVGHAALG